MATTAELAAKRDYTKGVEGRVDIITHDAEDRTRLDLQHSVFFRIFDKRLLHAPVDLKDGDWVLDTGTATGIWLRHLAKETSAKLQYLGTDINPNFFPPASTLPENMRFETQSILDLPKEWTNKFTLIHQRLLISSLRKYEWKPALSEIYRTLEPGGWVQLFELRTYYSGPALASHLEMLHKLSDNLGMMHRDITLQLPDFLEQSGFVDVHQDTRGTPLGPWAGQDGIDGKKNMLGIIRWLKAQIMRGGGYGVVRNEAEYDELAEEIAKEVDVMPGSTALWTMFWARKPVGGHS